MRIGAALSRIRSIRASRAASRIRSIRRANSIVGGHFPHKTTPRNIWKDWETPCERDLPPL